MYHADYSDLIKEGFNNKIAKVYADILNNELNNACFDIVYTTWAHEHGFLAESAYAYGLDESNYTDYLSDYVFYKTWPLNPWTRIWINDKLTLKYLLSNTEYSDFMPKYYYYSSVDGLKKLIDAPNQLSAPSINELFTLLTEEGEIACKPCNGVTSLGFNKLSFYNNIFYINQEPVGEAEIADFILRNPNYIFTEYLRPNKHFSIYNPHIHTLRIVTLNVNGNNPRIIGGYLRIPHKQSGEANYIIIGSGNSEQFNIVVDVDFETGRYGPGKLTYLNRAVPIDCHPDNGVPLTGFISDYGKLKETVLSIARRFSTIEFMGFDIGITDKGFKCMEINSQPGIKYMQLFRPLLIDPFVKQYFSSKLNTIKYKCAKK